MPPQTSTYCHTPDAGHDDVSHVLSVIATSFLLRSHWLGSDSQVYGLMEGGDSWGSYRHFAIVFLPLMERVNMSSRAPQSIHRISKHCILLHNSSIYSVARSIRFACFYLASPEYAVDAVARQLQARYEWVKPVKWSAGEQQNRTCIRKKTPRSRDSIVLSGTST